VAQKDIVKLMVDGGLTKSDLLCQIQSDIANVSVVRPADTETTARGAAIAAGIAVGMWPIKSLPQENNKPEQTVFTPKIDEEKRGKMMAGWKCAVKLSFADM